MNCNVIQDLMVLYADNCCSEDSKAAVQEHIKSCQSCKRVFEEITEHVEIKRITSAPKAMPTRINDWKASILQSVLLFASFLILVFGIAREAATPVGSSNGLWALSVIVPTTGFMLSLANWYFVRLYPGRRAFANCSLLTAALFMCLGTVWAVLHYEGIFSVLLSGSAESSVLMGVGGVLYAALLAASRLLSDRYARMLGKE